MEYTVDVTEHWLLALGLIIPILTGLITRLDATNSTKAIVALVLSAGVGLLTQVAENGVGDFDLGAAFVMAAFAFIANLASYLGIWKPIGETEYVPLQARTSEFGIG